MEIEMNDSAMFTVFIVVPGITLIALVGFGCVHDYKVKIGMAEKGYEQVVVSGRSEPIWQKAKP